MKDTSEMYHCKDCPAFYEVKKDGLNTTGGGWEHKQIEGRRVLCCRPAEGGGKRKMERFCFYCLAKVPVGKKIGHKASWTGRTPTWCPVKEGAE